MRTVTSEQYNAAVNNWANSLMDFSAVKNLIPYNYVFHLSNDEIEWLNNKNLYKEFCAEIGVLDHQVIMILVPLGEDGQHIPLSEYVCSTIKELEDDLSLIETRQYTLINHSVLSKELKNTDKNSNMVFPVVNKPIMEQDKVVSAIESWRNDGEAWLYRECNEFEGTRIFRKFYVPADTMAPEPAALKSFICTFALKYSDIYQRMLVTMIFISFYHNDSISQLSPEYVSNTYDWSRPCPPICQI